MGPKDSVHLIKEPGATHRDSPLCEHCESPLSPASPHPLGLCPTCTAVEGIVLLYIRRRGWSPQREARIRAYARRARLQLPLFDLDPDPSVDLP
jgi:hypothetical protein